MKAQKIPQIGGIFLCLEWLPARFKIEPYSQSDGILLKIHFIKLRTSSLTNHRKSRANIKRSVVNEPPSDGLWG